MRLGDDDKAYLDVLKSHGCFSIRGSCRIDAYETIGDDLDDVRIASCLVEDSDVFLVSASRAATEKLNR